MRSCIYEGTVGHRRVLEREHSFSYSLFMMYLDLDELPGVFRPYWLWSADRPAVAGFRRSDHLGDPERSLSVSVRELVSARIGIRPEGAIRLLTGMRSFGYLMNPVSFYFCYDAAENLLAVVAEVTNTPWSEQFCYVLDVRAAEQVESAGPHVLTTRNHKEFHVSPFMPLDMSYHWRITAPGEMMNLAIASHTADGLAFEADLNLKRREISSSALASVLVRYPALSVKVAAGIYWQAFRLWMKRVTFFPHPRKANSNISTTAP